jgi:citrate lyase beta subunit
VVIVLRNHCAGDVVVRVGGLAGSAGLRDIAARRESRRIIDVVVLPLARDGGQRLGVIGVRNQREVRRTAGQRAGQQPVEGIRLGALAVFVYRVESLQSRCLALRTNG